MIETKQRKNERKFTNWETLDQGGRRYWYIVQSKSGWHVRYVKEVGLLETTLRFFQEVYDEKGILVEIHEKFPVDQGHQKV